MKSRPALDPRTLRILAIATTSMLAMACNQSDFGALGGGYVPDGDGQPMPGQDSRRDADIGCGSDDDCGIGEQCVESICQMARCKDGPYNSLAPFGENLRVILDQELVVSEGATINGYSPISSIMTAPKLTKSWPSLGGSISDMAGGEFVVGTVQQVAYVASGSSEIRIAGGAQAVRLSFPPISLAAGDVDGDGLDEVVGLGQHGNIAICHFDTNSCEETPLSGGAGLDVDVGDTNNDGIEEIIALLDQGGPNFHVVSLAGEGKKFPAGHNVRRLAAGDTNGDGIVELFALETKGFINPAHLFIFGGGGDGTYGEVSMRDLDGDPIDIATARLDTDAFDEVLVLRAGGYLDLLQGGEGQKSVTPVAGHQLQGSPQRIAASDFDGDSARMRLMSPEPELFPGPITPIMVGHFPPYDAEHSSGTSSFTVGTSELGGMNVNESISLSASVGLGFGVSIPFISGGISGTLSQSITRTKSEATSWEIGSRIAGNPDPKLGGLDYGLVTVSSGCYNTYHYMIEDPMGRFGKNGEELVVMAPVGETTITWSTRRYNAMAEALGNLPLVEIPYEIGNPDSYPNEVVKPNGDPVPAEDQLFVDLPSFLVADLGEVNIVLAASESQTVGQNQTISLDISQHLTFGGMVTITASRGVSEGFGYSITTGSNIAFAGKIPPIPDNPATPEDEYEKYAFETKPFVYIERYKDDEGVEQGYYVLSFAVSRP